MSEIYGNFYLIGTEVQWYEAEAAMAAGKPVFAVFRGKGRDWSDYILELDGTTLKKIIKRGREWDALYLKADCAFTEFSLPFPIDGHSGELFVFRRDCRSAEAKTRDIKEFLDRLEENRG